MNMQRCHEIYGRLIVLDEVKYRLDVIHLGLFVRYGPDKLLVNSTHGLHGMLFTHCQISVSNERLYWQISMA